MRRGRDQSGETSRSVVAFIGLLLMIGSVIWLQFSPVTKEPAPVTSKPPRPTQEGALLVVIDPGHGGVDTGAISAGLLEKDLTFDVAQRLQRVLHQHGFKTLLTRGGDDYKSLANRAEFANRQRDCIFVSIHFDEGKAATSSGVETFYAARQFDGELSLTSWLPFLQQEATQTSNLFSQSLAGFIQQSLVSRTQAVNRGTRAEQFYVIANVRHPAVLVEGGFLTNQDDIAKLASEEYRERMAIGMSEGIVQYRDALRGRQSTLAVATPEG